MRAGRALVRGRRFPGLWCGGRRVLDLYPRRQQPRHGLVIGDHPQGPGHVFEHVLRVRARVDMPAREIEGLQAGAVLEEFMHIGGV